MHLTVSSSSGWKCLDTPHIGIWFWGVVKNVQWLNAPCGGCRWFSAVEFCAASDLVSFVVNLCTPNHIVCTFWKLFVDFSQFEWNSRKTDVFDSSWWIHSWDVNTWMQRCRSLTVVGDTQLTCCQPRRSLMMTVFWRKLLTAVNEEKFNFYWYLCFSFGSQKKNSKYYAVRNALKEPFGSVLADFSLCMHTFSYYYYYYKNRTRSTQ